MVTTHANVEAQVTSLVEACEWSPDDHILLMLPLHHMLGIVNDVPRELRMVAEFPRNTMGKVQKLDMKTLLETETPT